MTKYQEIAKIIENKIMDLEYVQGDRLPSIRNLMDTYQCSRSTAIKAYEVLEEKHFIYAKKQSGFYVADNGIKPAYLDEYYPLNTGNPIVSTTSLVDAKHCLSIAIDQYSHSSLNISLQGVESLLEILPDFLSELGVYANKNNIYLIQGITQVLSTMTSSSFFHDKEYVLIEEPTYSYFIDFLKSFHIPTLTIKRDEKGIDLYELEELFKNYKIKYFYTIPRNHNPLGTTLNTKTRKKIAELAIKYNTYIIEDDYFGHCSSIPRYQPIYYYCNRNNCIYLTSFTKTIPYLRIGICAIPDSLKKSFNEIIQQSYYFSYQLPSLISQATLESYLRSSLYQKQVYRLECQLKEHYSIIKDTSKQWNRDIAEIIGGESGYYFSIRINKNVNINHLQKELDKHKISIARNERCFYNSSHFNNSIRLSIARIEPNRLKESLNIIYMTIVTLSNMNVNNWL